VTDIFLSYAREDREWVERLAAALEAEGLSLWWDDRLRGGQPFSIEIERAIEASAGVLVVWSEASQGSLWVRSEASAGMAASKLVPVLSEDVTPPIEFRQLHTWDLRDWAGEADHRDWQRLLADVRERLTTRGKDPPHADQERAAAGSKRTQSNRVRPRWLLPAALTAATTVAAIVGYLQLRPDTGSRVDAGGDIRVDAGAGGIAVVAGGDVNVDTTAIADALVQRHQAELAAYQQREQDYQRQVGTLHDAIQALAAARSEVPNVKQVDEALKQLADGDPGPAEAVFADLQNMRSAQGKDGVTKAAAAARHRGALAFLRDTDAALAAYQQAVEIDPTAPEGWNSLGDLRLRVGDMDGAEAAYSRVLEIAVQQGDLRWRAVAQGNLGNVMEASGQLEQADDHYRRSLSLADELGDPVARADSLLSLGNVLMARGDLLSAGATYQRALTLYQEHDEQGGVAQAYGSLGNVALTRRELDQAENAYRRSSEIAEALGRPEIMANAFGNLAVVYLERQELDQAEGMLRRSLELEQQLRRQDGAASDYANLASIHLLRGELDQAESAARKALALEQELKNPAGMARSYSVLGLIARARGAGDEDEALHRKALALAQEAGDKAGQARDYSNLGSALEARGARDEAGALYRRAIALYDELGAETKVAELAQWLEQLPQGTGTPIRNN
jgi:tetratricopeptide (TPR) repeat protein